MNPYDPAIWVTAFLAGLLGSGHCFGMCGGIAGSLGALTGTNNRSIALPALPCQLRTVAGLCNAGRAGRRHSRRGRGDHGAQTPGQMAACADRADGAADRVAVPVRLAWPRPDRKGRGRVVAAHHASIAVRISQRHDSIGRLGLGVCWGFLPCGLVYTVLITAASTGHAAAGAITMIAFGMGTLPAMLGLTLAAPALSVFLGDRFVRRIVGFSLVVLAVWMFLILIPGGSATHAH